MKNCFLLLFCLTTIFAFGQKNKKIPLSELDQIRGLYFQRNTIPPFTGKAISKYRNGQKQREISFKDGKMHGKAFEWDQFGEKIFQAEYENGMQVGTEYQWYNNGNVKVEVSYVDGTLEGMAKEFYTDGKKQSEGLFTNGMEEGSHKWWHKNGNLEQEIPFVNGKAEGTIKKYHENGKLKFEGEYLAGQKNGISREWFDNGKKESEGKFVADKEDGEASFWDRTGRLIEQRIYENGSLIQKKNYRSASVNVRGGYRQVFNESGANFSVKIAGKDIKHINKFTYLSDNRVVQLLVTPLKDFYTKNDNSTRTILEQHLEHEKKVIEEKKRIEIKNIQKKYEKTSSGQEFLYWTFDSPFKNMKTATGRTLQEEHYVSMVCNDYVLLVYAPLSNSDSKTALQQYLKKTMDSVRIEKEAIDINALARRANRE